MPPRSTRKRLRFFLAGLALPLAIWSLVIEPDRLVIQEWRVESPAWPKDAKPLRIAAIADLHAGAPHITPGKVAQAVAMTNALNPDLIVLLGDYVSTNIWSRFTPPEETAHRLSALKAPLGVYAILGNHEGWFDAPRTRRAFERAGIPVLENESALLGGFFLLAGVADLDTGRPDLDQALAGKDPGLPVILLSHHPDFFMRAPPRVPLTLAGHTHGGQINLPLIGPLFIPSKRWQRYAYGLVLEDGHALVVSGGIGTSFLPARFNRPPEITLVTLSAPPR
jgi:predicted MPP superfamily phosphohydrolase